MEKYTDSKINSAVEAKGYSLEKPLPVAKMPAHWLMAQLGKRVLRPGGIETTRWLLDRLEIGETDDIVEFAPGLGVTAGAILALNPRSYIGVERDSLATSEAARVIGAAGHQRATVKTGDASALPLPAEGASVVVGEAMLSMQAPVRKQAIFGEAARILRPGGRYAIHELALAPDDIPEGLVEQIHKDLTQTIKVGVRIGTAGDWKNWLETAGFEVEDMTTKPMRLLEIDRLISDEGLLRTARFAFNALLTPGAMPRLRSIRSVFKKHSNNLIAIGIVARRSE